MSLTRKPEAPSRNASQTTPASSASVKTSTVPGRPGSRSASRTTSSDSAASRRRTSAVVRRSRASSSARVAASATTSNALPSAAFSPARNGAYCAATMTETSDRRRFATERRYRSGWDGPRRSWVAIRAAKRYLRGDGGGRGHGEARRPAGSGLFACWSPAATSATRARPPSCSGRSGYETRRSPRAAAGRRRSCRGGGHPASTRARCRPSRPSPRRRPSLRSSPTSQSSVAAGRREPALGGRLQFSMKWAPIEESSPE